MSGVKYSIEEYAPKIGEFLNPILDKAGIELIAKFESGIEIHPDYETPDIMVQFSDPDVDLLLANKAELLLALELLTQEAIDMPPEDHSRLCFDANDYRMLRVRELLLSAETAAERVKSTGRPFFFSPMTSRERRILHIALREEKTLRSESVGNGPFRQVCVLPVDMPLPPAPPRQEFPRGGGRGPDRGDRGDRGGPGRGPRGPRRDGPPRRDDRRGGGRRP